MNKRMMMLRLLIILIHCFLICNEIDLNLDKNNIDTKYPSLLRDNTVEYFVYPSGLQEFDLDYIFHGNNPNIAMWRPEYSDHIIFSGWEFYGSLTHFVQ